MKITKNNNTVILLSKAKQSKAKQSHNCLLNNNSKFYIFQFILFYKRIHAKSGQTPNSCSFLITKKNHAKGGQSSKTTSFCQKEAKTTPFRIQNPLVKTFSQYSESPSLRVRLKPVFDEQSNLNLVKSFLTSITFDSLSEKIKNLRLVIKKFQTRRIFK